MIQFSIFLNDYSRVHSSPVDLYLKTANFSLIRRATELGNIKIQLKKASNYPVN